MAVIATGFFDGVHLGHRFVLGRLVSEARARGERARVITFWPHPRTVLQNDARTLRLLTSLDEKRALLEGLGVDDVEVIGFSREFSRLSTEEYLRDYVRDRFGGTAVVLGYDNRMGCDAGTPDEIASVAESLGLEVVRADKLDAGDVTISSTKIREALSRGDVVTAAGMLGYSYRVHGVVVAGNRLGRTIGFPTANIRLYEPLKLIPAGGVYLVEVETLGEKFHGMCNIGVRPTVSSSGSMSIETNIFGFDEEIYGLDIKLSFIRKIRDERRFESLDELKLQLASDKEFCLSLI